MESLMQSRCSPVIIPIEACIHIEVCIHHFMKSPSKSVLQSKQLQNPNQHNKSHQNPVPVEVFLMLKLGGKLKLDESLYEKSVKKRRSGQIIKEIGSVQCIPLEVIK